MLLPTCDTEVMIEAQAVGYIRYRRRDGYRWEVYGICDGRGKCWEGAVNEKPTLDCPVTPALGKRCCPFEYIELPGCDAGTF